MYYITKKDTETGKKFQALKKKMEVIFQQEKLLSEKYGFFQWKLNPFTLRGAISCVGFKDENQVDTTIWKKENGFYSPRKNTKKGKEIQAEFDNTPIVSWEDLNACVGVKESSFHIGFKFNNDTYFGFTAKEEWEVEVPEDCEEITLTKWKEFFKEE